MNYWRRCCGVVKHSAKLEIRRMFTGKEIITFTEENKLIRYREVKRAGEKGWIKKIKWIDGNAKDLIGLGGIKLMKQ